MTYEKFPLQQIYRERLKQIFESQGYYRYDGKETTEEIRIANGQKIVILPREIRLGIQ